MAIQPTDLVRLYFCFLSGMQSPDHLPFADEQSKGTDRNACNSAFSKHFIYQLATDLDGVSY